MYLLHEPGFLWKNKLLSQSKDCVTMTGNESPDISALCQGTSERLPVGVERVSPDEPCQCRGGLGAPLSKQINIATGLLYLQACNY